MRRFFSLMIVGGWGLTSASSVFAQAVQLPTFNYFTVDTTVSVPDRGGAYLGGVNRAASGSTTRGYGPLRNRAMGSNIVASSASVHATIIDHDELDREVLAEAARRRAARGEVAGEATARPLTPEQLRVANKADFLARHVARKPEPVAAPTTNPPVESIAAIRAQAQARSARREAEAKEKLATGITQEAAGKYASARGYYEAAIRANVAGVKEEASRRLAKIALPKKSERVAEKP